MLETIHVIYIALRIGIAEWFNDEGAHVSPHKEDIVTLIEVEKEQVFAKFRKGKS